MKLIEKLIKIILNIILIFMSPLIVVAIYNFIQINILKQGYNTFFGFSIFNISSGSMKETIQIDDIIIVKEEQDFNEGDIITFFKDEQIITHRIIEKLDDGNFVTKGDANNSKDSKVYRQNIIGKVIKIVPKGGVWIKVFSDSKVIICVVITLIFIGITLQNGEEEKKRRRNRNHFSGFIKNVRGNLINDKKKKEKK